MKNGKRNQIDSWTGRVTSGDWHSIRFEAEGNRLNVFGDGRKIIDHRDTTFTEAGLVGLWTKADSVTYFDDLEVETL